MSASCARFDVPELLTELSRHRWQFPLEVKYWLYSRCFGYVHEFDLYFRGMAALSDMKELNEALPSGILRYYSVNTSKGLYRLNWGPPQDSIQGLSGLGET